MAIFGTVSQPSCQTQNTSWLWTASWAIARPSRIVAEGRVPKPYSFCTGEFWRVIQSVTLYIICKSDSLCYQLHVALLQNVFHIVLVTNLLTKEIQNQFITISPQ